MYDWHYNYFVKKFNCNLLFTDTDSLVYEIRGIGNIYKKIYEDKNLFDFSDYSRESRFMIIKIKKLLVK